jgi:hypothetical protein
MILYVNGDSHAAAAECINPYAWAEDDGLFWGLGRRPHPDNERVSFGCELANHLYAILFMDAQSGGSNARIMRTTRNWVTANKDQLGDAFIVIQWSTWEREEWFYDDIWWQVNASGTDHLPDALQQQYKDFVINLNWNDARIKAHNDIWQFHCELKDLGVQHLMFNGNNHFGEITNQKDWGASYMHPYNPKMTYDNVLREQGFKTVNPQSWHFGPDAHCFWGKYLLQYMHTHKLV